MNANVEPSAKVLFRVPNEDGTAEVETLWAFPLGDDKYRLDNSPFYAYSVSVHDVVLAPFDANEGFPTFHRVESKSGNRTVRVVFDTPVEPGNEAQRVLDGLVELGCGYEGATRRYVSINIPPQVELNAVRDYLTEKGATWEHADPIYSELHPGEK